MNKKKEKKLVPKLRFPGFIYENGWHERPIKTLAERVIQKNQKLDITTVFTNSAVGGIVNQRDYFEKDIANQEGLQNYYVVSPGDYVYNPRISNEAPVGPISKNNTEKTGVMSPLYTVFRFFEENNGFYEYYFKTNHWFKAIKKAANTGARFDRMSITDSAFMDILVLYPKPEEQQKIAACLSSLDDLISAENEKLNVLNKHKKSLMQQLFPTKGETKPKLRFPEFKESEEWEDRSFGDLLYSIIDFRGRTPIKLGMSWGGGNVISLSANNVKNGYIDYDAKCHLGSDKLFDKWMGKVKLEKGDVVFTMEAPLGNALLVPDNQKYILSQRVVAFKTKENVHNDFLVQLIWSSQFQNEIERLSTGSTAKGINQKRLNKLRVLFPKSIKEQQIISNILESIDNEITIQSFKLKQLKKHKKGLMQHLFPNFN
eukprot:TRINITY_DN31156_c0_g1_i1.p1 TRINITY_DN31156_c0_g1~~TRINITY_DN31156_c0_g1_i1.p1  ORF type:complete len:429 (-),score=44.48 TRINITY_DN31156_c0_g1_i1:602-1888(-)